MKKLFPLLALLTLLLSVASCKTTEANYRNAYEIAKEKSTAGLTSEEIDGFLREESTPKTLYKGDSIPLRGAFVKTVATRKGETPPQVQKFNIIVASFKQLFNARSVCERLEAAGYDGAAVLIDRDEQYFVSAASYADLDSAVASLREIRQNPPLPIRQPFPYILDKAR